MGLERPVEFPEAEPVVLGTAELRAPEGRALEMALTAELTAAAVAEEAAAVVSDGVEVVIVTFDVQAEAVVETEVARVELAVVEDELEVVVVETTAAWVATEEVEAAAEELAEEAAEEDPLLEPPTVKSTPGFIRLATSHVSPRIRLTTLVRLVYGSGIPVVVDDAGTRGRALVAQVAGDGDAEACLVRRDGHRVRGEDIPRNQGGSDGSVGGGLNNGDIGNTGVRCADVERKRHYLTSGVGLDKVGVVGVFVSLAHPNVALGGIVVGLRGGDLEHTLDVAVVIFGTSAIETVRTNKILFTYHPPGCSTLVDHKQLPC